MIMFSIQSSARSDKVAGETHWLDRGKPTFGDQFMEEVKAVWNVAFMMLPLPIFWALFDQQGSRWTFQATRMNGNFFNLFRLEPDNIQVWIGFNILIRPKAVVWTDTKHCWLDCQSRLEYMIYIMSGCQRCPHPRDDPPLQLHHLPRPGPVQPPQDKSPENRCRLLLCCSGLLCVRVCWLATRGKINWFLGTLKPLKT